MWLINLNNQNNEFGRLTFMEVKIKGLEQGSLVDGKICIDGLFFDKYAQAVDYIRMAYGADAWTACQFVNKIVYTNI